VNDYGLYLSIFGVSFHYNYLHIFQELLGVPYMLRFAISPTGDMHIGNLRVAILNFLVAQQRKEGFIVRIDDTNKARNIEGKDTEIMQILEKFALNHESVFHQSEHLHMHQTLAIKLLAQDKAFICTCTEEETNKTPHCSGHCSNADKADLTKIKASGTPFVIRINKPIEDLIITDLIHDSIKTKADNMDSFVILEKDGSPSDIFASACDDMLSGINILICEDEQVLSTAKQLHIKKQLGFDAQTQYLHLPVVTHGDDHLSLKWLFSEGYVPDAIINYLLLLDYTQAPSEVFTLPDAIEWFNIKNISTSSVEFDLDKLSFINRQHLKNMEDKALSSLFGFADADIGKLAKLYLEEVSTTTEIDKKIKAIFSPKHFEGEYSEQMRTLENLIQNAPMFSTFKDFSSYLMQKSGLKDDNFFKPLRLLITAEADGPDLNNLYSYIKSYILEIAS